MNRFLLDTHLLLWSAGGMAALPAEAAALIDDPGNELLFSPASLWEIAIKSALGREDFTIDARLLRRGLLANAYRELPITGEHALAVGDLPALHKDPFDRLLIAQATVEGIVLLTADTRVVAYPGPIRAV